MNTNFTQAANELAHTNHERGLPKGVAAELEAAAQRTGWTKALETAASKLPVILTMDPAHFERMCSKLLGTLTTL